MSELEKLIKELCPNGVEYKKISDVATMSRGIRVIRSQLAVGGHIPVYQNSLTPLGYYDKSNCTENTTFIISAGAAGEIGYSKQPFWAADDCWYFDCPECLNSRFLYHVLQSQQQFISSNVRRSSVPRLSRSVIDNMLIPVPPLEVQSEIVKVLDKYSTSVIALQQELTKELTARKKQYEHYRDRMLSFDEIRAADQADNGGGGYNNNVIYRKLGEVARFMRGITYNKGQESHNGVGIKVLRANNITLDYNTLNFDDIKIVDKNVKVKDEQYLEKNDILICAGSGSKDHIGKVAYIKENMDYTFGGFMGVIRVTEECNSRFMFHILTGGAFKKYLEATLNSSTINNLNSQVMNNFFLPVPPLETQKRIVSILDKFEMLANSLSDGLPAEIEARKKQYEYYRDKLLDFKDAGGGVLSVREAGAMASAR